jgi:branched-chain amino acid transport system substrate-binding protein
VPGRVHVSLPLTGPAADIGRDVLRGAQLAHARAEADAPELVVRDAYAVPERDDRSEANARAAAADAFALAYLGDFHSSQVARSAPILAEAGMLAVAPAATWTELGSPTLVRLMPHDGALAHGVAGWIQDTGIEDVLVVHDYGDEYGEPVGRLCAEAARERGLQVRIRRIWDHDEQPAADLQTAQAVLYVGVAGSGLRDLWARLHAANPDLWLLGTDGIEAPWFARELSAQAAGRTRIFTARRAPYAFYGYEAMALILDALAAGDDRAAVVAHARATRDRDSLLGRYSLDADGHTTAPADGRLAVVDARIVWDR